MIVREIILAELRTEGGCSAAELAIRLGWRPASVRAEISRLRAGGLPIRRQVRGRWRAAIYSLCEPGDLNQSLLTELRRLSDRQLETLIGAIEAERMLGLTP